MGSCGVSTAGHVIGGGTGRRMLVDQSNQCENLEEGKEAGDW